MEAHYAAIFAHRMPRHSVVPHTFDGPPFVSHCFACFLPADPQIGVVQDILGAGTVFYPFPQAGFLQLVEVEGSIGIERDAGVTILLR